MIQAKEKKPLPLMTRAEIEEFTTLSRSTIYAMMNPESDNYDPSFPVPVRIGKKRVVWVRNEMVAWVKHQIEFCRVDFKRDNLESMS